MLTQPVTSRPCTTVPGLLIVSEPDGLSCVPAGTPVFDAFGKPQEPSLTRQSLPDDPPALGDGLGVAGGAGALVGDLVGAFVGDLVGGGGDALGGEAIWLGVGGTGVGRTTAAGDPTIVIGYAPARHEVDGKPALPRRYTP